MHFLLLLLLFFLNKSPIKAGLGTRERLEETRGGGEEGDDNLAVTSGKVDVTGLNRANEIHHKWTTGAGEGMVGGRDV